jgi:hypothetical protein
VVAALNSAGETDGKSPYYFGFGNGASSEWLGPAIPYIRPIPSGPSRAPHRTPREKFKGPTKNGESRNDRAKNGEPLAELQKKPPAGPQKKPAAGKLKQTKQSLLRASCPR